MIGVPSIANNDGIGGTITHSGGNTIHTFTTGGTLNIGFPTTVSYLIVGGEAVIYYGHVRLTGDIDIFYENTAGNSNALFKALNDGPFPIPQARFLKIVPYA